MFLIWHQTPENCGRGHWEIGLGVMKDDAKRVYVHARACYFTPEIIITIAVTAPNAIPGEQVGVVEDAQRRGSIRREFANLQAWFYPAAGALMLWEVDLWRGREENPAQDFLLACLWDGFERGLLRVFPDAREVITPREPNYDSQSWAAFLADRGYVGWSKTHIARYWPQVTRRIRRREVPAGGRLFTYRRHASEDCGPVTGKINIGVRKNVKQIRLRHRPRFRR